MVVFISIIKYKAQLTLAIKIYSRYLSPVYSNSIKLFILLYQRKINAKRSMIQQS